MARGREAIAERPTANRVAQARPGGGVEPALSGSRRALARATLVGLGLVQAANGAWAVFVGWALWVLLLILLPARLNALTLGWSFDYLPHCRLESQEEAGRFRTTRNRVGWEWLMTPLMLYQNYHLVHHLHPVVPFYRYLSVWRLRECQYLDRDPALSTIRGRPLSAGEYRRLRALGH
jgi:fatty acid desaturase